jgi:hypothetical protein
MRHLLSRPRTIALFVPSVLARALVIGAAGGVLALGGVAAAATGPTGTGGRRFNPGTIGKVAAISGTSMEVQSTTTGQTTVDWTSSTTFSQTSVVSLSSIAAGDCVTITGKTSKKSKKSITATSVSVSQPTSSGTCTGSALGGPRTFGSGGPPSGSFTPPSGRSGSFAHRFAGKGAPSPGHGFAGLANFGFASGKVTAVGGKSLTVDGISSADVKLPTPKSTSDKAKATSAKGKKPLALGAQKKSTFPVTVNASTTYSETGTAAASALAVGDCVTASGKTATNGTVAATEVHITSTGASSCGGGFTAFGGAGPGGATGSSSG